GFTGRRVRGTTISHRILFRSISTTGHRSERASPRFRTVEAMSEGLTDAELAHFFATAEPAVWHVSHDDQVARGAADHALQQLIYHLDSVSTAPAARETWVRTVARNDAKHTGERLHREKAFGQQGSIPPRNVDQISDEFVATLIAEMHHGP